MKYSAHRSYSYHVLTYVLFVWPFCYKFYRQTSLMKKRICVSPKKSNRPKDDISYEQELVRQAFQANNYTSIAKLPHKIIPQFHSSQETKKRFEHLTKPSLLEP